MTQTTDLAQRIVTYLQAHYGAELQQAGLTILGRDGRYPTIDVTPIEGRQILSDLLTQAFGIAPTPSRLGVLYPLNDVQQVSQSLEQRLQQEQFITTQLEIATRFAQKANQYLDEHSSLSLNMLQFGKPVFHQDQVWIPILVDDPQHLANYMSAAFPGLKYRKDGLVSKGDMAAIENIIPKMIAFFESSLATSLLHDTTRLEPTAESAVPLAAQGLISLEREGLHNVFEIEGSNALAVPNNYAFGAHREKPFLRIRQLMRDDRVVSITRDGALEGLPGFTIVPLEHNDTNYRAEIIASMQKLEDRWNTLYPEQNPLETADKTRGS